MAVQYMYEKERKIPVKDKYDVIVCGGGPSGFVAAVASARCGVRTLLIERYGFPGGTATAGMMVEFGSIYDGKQVIVGGITHEFLHRLEKFGGAIMKDEKTHSMVFDPESMIMVSLEMLVESGCEIMFHTLACEPIVEENIVKGVITESKSGRQAIFGKVVIDTTGDGDIAARAGAKYQMGHRRENILQPVSLEIIVGNVDATKITPETYFQNKQLIARAKEKGEWTIPTERFFSWGRVLKRGQPQDPKNSFFFLNATNVLNINGCNVDDLTRAEIESRRQVDQLINFLRKYMRGFENCYLDRVACQVGIRETRRITGDYLLTGEDVLSARHFEDGVVPACSSIDVHDPEGKDFGHEYLKEGTHYEIPYRCFLPKEIEGILVGGRCISADYRALGSTRVMVVCMPIGEAIGTAAAIAVKEKCVPRKIPVQKLKFQLRDAGMSL
ncbi:MAG: FAD-dependent oxidoreductase [bacterium]|nr:FAD-dependent oxidoreductase [bacterium]